MKRSKLFATTSKESEAEFDCRSAELAVKAGLVHNYGSGTFGFTHLGQRVLDNIEEAIRDEMDEIGQEVTMNILQNSEMWERSGRWKNFEGDEFFTLKNRDDRDFTIAATHEEASVELVRKKIRSYRDLDFMIYQIGRKFRDDRARKGLLRGKEFFMKDAYSFHADEDQLQETYDEMLESYRNIFEKLGLEFSIVAADNGSMGGSESHEFMAESEIGSDTYLKCSNSECSFAIKDLEVESCQDCSSELDRVNGIEIGHLFQLGDRYSSKMDLTFQDRDDGEKNVLMASYGIGVSRLISAIIEQNNDENGTTWNDTVSAFDCSIIVARHEEEAEKKAEELHEKLSDRGLEVLLFDEGSVGEKFAESDLMGINRKVIIGQRFLEEELLEVEYRDGEKSVVDVWEVEEESYWM